MANFSFTELVIIAVLFLVICFSMIRLAKSSIKWVVNHFAAVVAEKMKNQS
jgi:hypothetical protein